MTEYRKLNVWQEAMSLTEEVYRVTTALPSTEPFGLVTQMRRSSVSIPSNIAEGCGRSGDPELARFLQIAMGSASELEYQLLLAHDLHFLADSEHERLSTDVTEVKRMLASFIQKLKADR